MREISGALIAIGLVLVAVFVPAALISGIPGIFYRQFAVTIAAAAAISTIISLTLSPALAALLLKPHSTGEDYAKERRSSMSTIGFDGRPFNKAFDWVSDRYGSLTARLVHRSTLMLVIYGGLLGLTVWRLSATPTGYIPDQDQGFLIGVIQLPPGSSLERTEAAVEGIRKDVSQNEMILETAAFAGSMDRPSVPPPTAASCSSPRRP